MSKKKNKLLILYDYFTPAFLAGGPIQSLNNLVKELELNYEIFVICSNYDFGGIGLLNIKFNEWCNFENGPTKIFYLKNPKINFFKILFFIKLINPSKIFVNGIYSFAFSILPALFYSSKIIMHTRGMLHPGALSKKKTKKKIYIYVFKLSGLHRKISFCVSDLIEEKHVRTVFGAKSKIWIAQNFPKYFPVYNSIKKNVGDLKLCSIGLISPMKNHALIVEALFHVKSNIIWDVYGPIKDLEYWNKILKVIPNLPENITFNYYREISPVLVYGILHDYHISILPSESENFGHALFESMIAGKPIITSKNTPWFFLETNSAGINVDLNVSSVVDAIEKFAFMNQFQYDNYVKGVRIYAEKSIDRNFIKSQYLNMFGFN